MKNIINEINTLSILKNDLITQAAKYSKVGSLCTVLDFVMLFLIAHFSGLINLVASIITFMSVRFTKITALYFIQSKPLANYVKTNGILKQELYVHK